MKIVKLGKEERFTSLTQDLIVFVRAEKWISLLELIKEMETELQER